MTRPSLPALFALIPALLLVAIVTSSAGRVGGGDGNEPTAKGVSILIEELAEADDDSFRRTILDVLRRNFEGRGQVSMPERWPEVRKTLDRSESTAVRAAARRLSVIFGDEEATRHTRRILMDGEAERARRIEALRTLRQAEVEGLAEDLFALLDDPALRTAVLRTLGDYDHAETPRRILERFETFDAEGKRSALSTLSGRADYARQLLEAVDRGDLEAEAIGAYALRQLSTLDDERVQRLLDQLYTSGDGSEAREKMLRYSRLLTPSYLSRADLRNGRRLYNQSCAACHKLYGEGGEIGPELTGSDRHNLDYLLRNIITPSEMVANDYRLHIVRLDDGRVLTGIIANETDQTLTVQMQTERIRVDRSRIESRQPMPVSMMPPGLLAPLTADEVRDLIAYLQSNKQVPLPEEENAEVDEQ